MERDELVPNPWTAPGAPRASVSADRPASCYGPVHGLILEGLLQDEARPVILEAVPVRDATVRDHDEAVGDDSRAALVTAAPSTTGISKSVMTTSKAWPLCTAATASLPDVKAWTS